MSLNEKKSLDAWINQHLAAREERMRAESNCISDASTQGASPLANPFVWHKPNANDLLPSTSIDITPIDLDKPINFK